MKTRIAIAEDNLHIANSLKEKLSRYSKDVEIVFIANNGEELLNKLKKADKVDLILMDIEMPVMDGIEASRRVKEIYPDIHILILTVFDDDDKIFNAIKNGASGYLLKEESPETIYEAINVIMDGGAISSASIALKILNILKRSELTNGRTTQAPVETFGISKREIEILERLKEGKDYKKIADELFISPSTVRKHIENIYSKLQVHNKMEAVQKGIKYNIIK